jgi:glycosyltransferase involved in cell wall biosynthesis
VSIIFIIAALVILVYCLFIGYIIAHIQNNFSKSDWPQTKVSIIIPARNEADNIANCLHSIALQTLPQVQFEIILIDDFSEDNTVKIAMAFKNKLPLTILNNHMPGKKNALALGINHASYDTILTTDADCTMDREWLKTMLSIYEKEGLNMLCGPVNLIADGSFFKALQQTESAAIVGISATMLQKQMPATCNGANLMYSKTVFMQLNGYKHHLQLASGDDDLLLHAFFNQSADKVGYTLNYHAMVNTAASVSFKTFIHQRSRWLSKRKYYAYPWNAHLQKLVVVQLIAFYYLLFYAINTHSLLAIAFILNKYMFDLMLGTQLKMSLNFRYLQILLMPFYELYILFVLLHARFAKAEWKGRGV